MPTTAFRICPLCEATCGLALEVEEDRIVTVRGDDDHVFSRGYLCPKGAAFGDLDHDPERLDGPLVRRNGQLVPVSWDEAFAHLATRLTPLLDTHGPESVALYLGNPNVHNLSGQLYNRALIRATGSRTITSASTVDQMPKHRSCGELFGDPLAIPVPDIDRTDHLLVIGANPLMSNGSLMTAPDIVRRLQAIRDRGGRVVVVDPRRSRTARAADQYVSIRPGTDALLLAAMVTSIANQGLVDLGGLAPHVNGVDEVIAALGPFTPEAVAPHTGIDAGTISSMAHEFASASTAAVHGRIGTHTTRFGTLAAWLVDVLHVLTGNLDRAGGAMFPLPAHEDRAGRRPQRFGRFTSRVSRYPEVVGELPASCLAEEITTPGEGRIRVLVVVAGNPVLSTPRGDLLEEAFGDLDLMVVVDPYLTATSRHADVVLPPPPARFRGHMDLSFAALSIRNTVTYSPPVVPLPDGRPDEWEVLLRLAALFQGQPPDVDVDVLDDLVAGALAGQLATREHARTNGLGPEDLLHAVAGRRGPERLLDLLLRSGPYGDGFGEDPDGLTFERVAVEPHGIDLGPLTPRLPAACNTATGKVELAPPALVADLDRLAARLDQPVDDESYLLVGRRHLRTNNSWMHNLERLDGRSSLCTLWVHRDDAEELGLVDGGEVEVSNDHGSLVATVEVTLDIRRGVVSLPHGFGHEVTPQDVRHRGVNVNLLATTVDLDPLSGNATLNALPVTLAPA